MFKKVFNPGNYPQNINVILLMLRITVGGFMLSHGVGKFSKLFSGDPIKFADPIGVGEPASLALTVFAEFFCSLCLILGMATRFATIPLLVNMAVVVIVVHGADGFSKQELPLLYIIVYLALAIAGAGKISIDNWIYKKMR